MTGSNKQYMRLRKIRNQCLEMIKRHGAYAKIVVHMPGTLGRGTTRKYSWNGPRGRIFARTFDGTKILVKFPASKLCKSMEELINGDITG